MSEKGSGRKDEKSKKMFLYELKEVISSLYNHPSIICYTLFNEGWGEFEPDKVYDLAKSYDKFKIYDTTSGWYLNKKRDLYSIHAYILSKSKRKDKKENKPYILSECGGINLKLKDHALFKGQFTQSLAFSKDDLTKKYGNFYKNAINLVKNNQLFGIIYTQLNDCEKEYNGLYTFDREVLKIDEDIIKGFNREIENSN